jgi:hypothetical protein
MVGAVAAVSHEIAYVQRGVERPDLSGWTFGETIGELELR